MRRLRPLHLLLEGFCPLVLAKKKYLEATKDIGKWAEALDTFMETLKDCPARLSAVHVPRGMYHEIEESIVMTRGVVWSLAG